MNSLGEVDDWQHLPLLWGKTGFISKVQQQRDLPLTLVITKPLLLLLLLGRSIDTSKLIDATV